jgi:ABC-type transport system involved in cytochrome c biogenesis ATPase subunit
MALTVEGLACIRGERQLFTDLQFRLAAGEALLLHGPNGSGKSSLLRLLAGFLSPAAGKLLWDGAAVSDDTDAHRARLLYLGHLDAVKPQLTATENLAFFARLMGATSVAAEAQAKPSAQPACALSVGRPEASPGVGPAAAQPGRALAARRTDQCAGQ